MKRLLIALTLLLPALASAHDWQVDAAHSTLGFSGEYQDGPFHGTFKHFTAKIAYDPADLAHARFDVEVDLASVDTQSAERDQTLAGSDFFDTAKTPKAHFVTQSFDKTADGSVTAHGTLALHGISKPVTLKVSFAQNGNTATLDVDATLARLDWNLGAGDDWADLGKQVSVHGHLALQ